MKINCILLSAGLGERLKPLTRIAPKCLMPIQGRPILEYWLNSINKNKSVDKIFVNIFYMADSVKNFINNSIYTNKVCILQESKLYGTAGSIRHHKKKIGTNRLLVIHSDNWSSCSINKLIDKHKKRPLNCCITMASFRCNDVTQCGIIEIDKSNILRKIDEKPLFSENNLANAAIYIFEPEVLTFINSNKDISDIANDVLPNFYGRIYVTEIKSYHRDIGTIKQLKMAQKDKSKILLPNVKNSWQKNYEIEVLSKIKLLIR